MAKNLVAPGEGERRAQRGYVAQYDGAAAAIYTALARNDLQWVGLADRGAGVADDVVLGLLNRVIGHQFKTSQYAEPFRLSTLLLGSEGLLVSLVHAWQRLRASFPGSTVEIRLVTNDYPATSDDIAQGAGGHSAAMVRELDVNRGRSVAAWRMTRWWQFVDRMLTISGLSEASFEEFLAAFHLMSGAAADFLLINRLSPTAARQAREIAAILPRLVADERNRDRWLRADLLEELGWRDSFALRRAHQFPLGSYAQRNAVTERKLRAALDSAMSGYVALVGAPGAGKSTLLQMALVSQPRLSLVRYLAFVPGEAQSMGRGEAEDFFDDINAQLRRSGLGSAQFLDRTLQEKRQRFESLIGAAAERFRTDGVRTALVIDGLDHVPREEKPQRSLLAELPLPSAVPEGVTIVLGTQRLDLVDLCPAVAEQASLADRKVVMTPLSREAVHRIADMAGLVSEISRDRLFDLSLGHPLVSRYLVEALRIADAARTEAILAGELSFRGEVEAVYASAWRNVENDPEAREIMDYIARAEGSIPPEMLAEATSKGAVERAFASTRHLLDLGRDGWRVFHNSFRLFVLDRPKLLFGSPDPGHAKRVYERLAELTRSLAGSSPHRWLELRYLARAESHEKVLLLARPERFRGQLAEGREISDLRIDVRLAFAAVRRVGDGTDLFRVLLIQDELARRATTLEYAPALPGAFLALGDVDAAQNYAGTHGGGTYDVVDALVQSGEIDRARALFDRSEPLAALSGSVRDLSLKGMELDDWSRRVHLFREVDQIHEAIDRIVAGEQARSSSDSDMLGARLRSAVARAAIADQPFTDPDELARSMRLGPDEMPFLLAQAAFSANESNPENAGEKLLVLAVTHPAFSTLPNHWRRGLAFLAFNRGRDDLAHQIFAYLISPGLASLDDSVSDGMPRGVVRAVVEHAELAMLLGEPLVAPEPSKRLALRPIQYHASAAGVLRASGRKGTVMVGEVARAARAFMLYMEHLRPGGTDGYYAMTAAAGAAPVIASALLKAASDCGQGEFERVLGEFDKAFADPAAHNSRRLDLRRKIAVVIFRLTGDTERATSRLHTLVAETREETPESQVEELARCAEAFAKIGDEASAREVLRRVHEETLGYARAPKKDPQYALWLHVLQQANAVDPAGRAGRVAFMMRQLSGMKKTEGEASARRIASAVLTEAALVDHTSAFAVGQAMVVLGLLSWDGIVNATLFGVVRRRPDLAAAGAATWCSLALPFYAEPYYRSSKLGEVVTAVLDTVEDTRLPGMIETLRTAIGAESVHGSRSGLLERLVAGAERRGACGTSLLAELGRWRGEEPPDRHAGTPGRYDDVVSLSALEERCQADNDQGNWGRAYAFAKLVPTSKLDQALRLFNEWPDLQQDTRARFALAEKAFAEGDRTLAQRLVAQYPSQANERARWTRWMGGGKLDYFRSRIRLEGAAVHSDAFDDLLTELAAGHEVAESLLIECEELFPVVVERPDWPVIWKALAEQLAQTREYAIGEFFAPHTEVASDEELIAQLFQWALTLTVREVDRHVHVGALRLLSVGDQGRAVFEHLVRRLLADGCDGPVTALLLLSWAPGEVMKEVFFDAVTSRVDHIDYVVGVLAEGLARQWDASVAMSKIELPSFYRIMLDADDGSEFAVPLTIDPKSRAMRIEDPIGWTFAFSRIIEPLARGGVTVAHIRRRCAMLINSWGGLDTYGHRATEMLEAQLGRLDLRLTYARPHMVVAFRALRHVAGEMRRAGLLERRDEAALLHMLDSPPVGLPVPIPTQRPLFVMRPPRRKTDWREDEHAWLNEAETDLRPLRLSGDFIIADWSRYSRRDVRREFKLERLRVPSCKAIEGSDLEDWLDKLPRAVWFDDMLPLSAEPSVNLLRSVKLRFGTDIPNDFLVICPYWLRRLRWRRNPENWLTYLDVSGRVVAKITWWRDGGPGDVQEDICWAEGIIVAVTPEGHKPLEASFGEIRYAAATRRVVKPEPGGGEARMRLVKSPD